MANLAAANTYKLDHLNKGFFWICWFSLNFLLADVWETISSCHIYYSAGFFLTPPEGTDSMEKIAKHAAENNKVFIFQEFK